VYKKGSWTWDSEPTSVQAAFSRVPLAFPVWGNPAWDSKQSCPQAPALASLTDGLARWTKPLLPYVAFGYGVCHSKHMPSSGVTTHTSVSMRLPSSWGCCCCCFLCWLYLLQILFLLKIDFTHLLAHTDTQTNRHTDTKFARIYEGHIHCPNSSHSVPWNCVCMCICMFVCVYECMCICVCIYVCVYVCCVYVCVCLCMYVCMCICVYMCICMCVSVCVCYTLVLFIFLPSFSSFLSSFSLYFLLFFPFSSLPPPLLLLKILFCIIFEQGLSLCSPSWPLIWGNPPASVFWFCFVLRQILIMELWLS